MIFIINRCGREGKTSSQKKQHELWVKWVWSIVAGLEHKTDMNKYMHSSMLHFPHKFMATAKAFMIDTPFVSSAEKIVYIFDACCINRSNNKFYGLIRPNVTIKIGADYGTQWIIPQT